GLAGRGGDRGGRRRGLGLAGGALAAVAAAGAAVLALARAPGPAPCTDGAERLAPVWSPQRAAAIQEAVGPAAWTALGPALARFADGWIAGHAGACGAPRAAAQPAELRERRM